MRGIRPFLKAFCTKVSVRKYIVCEHKAGYTDLKLNRIQIEPIGASYCKPSSNLTLSASAASTVGRPFSTVRGWLRSAKASAEEIEAYLSGLGQAVSNVVAVATNESGLARLVSACARFAVSMGWPISDWLVASASACRCRLLQRSWWIQHEPTVATLAVVMSLSGTDP